MLCYRVLGPTAVLQLSERDEPPPASARPLYSLAMRGAVICFSGFRKKDELVSTYRFSIFLRLLVISNVNGLLFIFSEVIA